MFNKRYYCDNISFQDVFGSKLKFMYVNLTIWSSVELYLNRLMQVLNFVLVLLATWFMY